MTSVLALDLASRSGWAAIKDGWNAPRANFVDLPALDDMGKWSKAFIEWCIPKMKEFETENVIIEAPFIAKHRRKGGKGPCNVCGRDDFDLNIHEAEKLLSIVTLAKYCATMVGATHKTIARGTVCKHFIGKGNGKRVELKQGCLVACQKKGWDVTSEDIADALATLDWYVYAHKIKVPWNSDPAYGPLFTAPPGGIVVSKKVPAGMMNSVLSFDRERNGGGA